MTSAACANDASLFAGEKCIGDRMEDCCAFASCEAAVRQRYKMKHRASDLRNVNAIESGLVFALRNNSRAARVLSAQLRGNRYSVTDLYNLTQPTTVVVRRLAVVSVLSALRPRQKAHAARTI